MSSSVRDIPASPKPPTRRSDVGSKAEMLPHSQLSGGTVPYLSEAYATPYLVNVDYAENDESVSNVGPEVHKNANFML